MAITAARVSGTSGELDYGSLPDVPTTLNVSDNPIAISDRRLVRILGTAIDPLDGAPELVDGAARLETVGSLAAGDAVRLTDRGGLRLSSATGAEVLVWEMHAALQPPSW